MFAVIMNGDPPSIIGGEEIFSEYPEPPLEKTIVFSISGMCSAVSGRCPSSTHRDIGGARFVASN
jgi:hypothetical protein